MKKEYQKSVDTVKITDKLSQKQLFDNFLRHKKLDNLDRARQAAALRMTKTTYLRLIGDINKGKSSKRWIEFEKEKINKTKIRKTKTPLAGSFDFSQTQTSTDFSKADNVLMSIQYLLKKYTGRKLIEKRYYWRMMQVSSNDWKDKANKMTDYELMIRESIYDYQIEIQIVKILFKAYTKIAHENSQKNKKKKTSKN